MAFLDTITKWRWSRRQDKRKESADGKKPTVFREGLRKTQEEHKKTTAEIISPSDQKRKVILPEHFLTGVLFTHHLTEKTSLSEQRENTYVFIVRKNAHARDVRSAVETRYGVSVEDVRMITMPGKERKRGREIGWKPGYKKAIVKVKEGESIEIV